MAKKGGNSENLISLADRATEEQREIARKGGLKSGEIRREKKLLSAMYADLLAKGFEIEGEKLSLDEVASAILARRDTASVSMLKEIREATEGSKLKLDGDIKTSAAFIFVDPPKNKDADTE